MRENLTHTIEDYLKTIYEITTCHKRASTNQIAEALGVTAASVSGMIKKLANTEPPLLEYRRHRGVALTPEGERIALEIVRHHRLLEMFLHQMLGYDWDQVHAEADRMEHVISEEFEERIAQALGNPSHDPHGDPIPTRDLSVPQTSSLQMADLQPGQSAVVRRVRNASPELLRHLGSLGLVPQSQFTVTDCSPFDGNLILKLAGQEQVIVLGPGVTEHIFVELL